MSRMRLAAVPCQLLPKSSITINSPMVGSLRVYVSQPRTNVNSGTVWAEFEPDIFGAESEALEEARAKLDQQEKIKLELDLPKQKLKLQRELEEAQRQFTLLTLLSTNQDLASKAFNIPGQQGGPMRPEAVDNARIELELLKQSLGYLETTNLAILGIDLPGQRSDWQRRKLEFERRQSQARLKMPFEGQLTISLPLTEGVQEYPVNVGQELAVARDLSLIRLRVSLANPAWVGLPTERLFAVVRLPNGQELQAPFAFQKIEKVQSREESVYYFQFPLESSETVARLVGADVSCEVWMTLPQAARIVPKLSLVLNQPGAFQGKGWAQGIQTILPGAQLMVEGQTDLAIVLPNLARK
jgi:hypothetical protein